METLAERYGCPVYHSLSDLLQDDLGKSVDGAIVCTPHSTHSSIGKELIAEGKRRYEEAMGGGVGSYRPMNVLMEKPMTTNVREARELHGLLVERREDEMSRGGVGSSAAAASSGAAIGGGVGCFLINHSANYRPQARAARALVQSGKLGSIRHVSAFFASPLSWIFDDPSNTGW